MSERMDAELRDHARREFAGNVLLKFTLLLVSVLAITTIVLLDRLKSHLNETKRKPYSYTTVETHLAKTASDPKLKLKAEMDVLAAALKEVPSDSSFASTDEAFAAMYERSAPEKSRRAEELEIRTRYAAALAEVNSALTKSLAGSPQPDFAKQFGLRTSLISARNVELQESQQVATAARTELKEAWDRSNPSQAKVPYAYFEVKQLDAATRHIVDPDDPLSIIYDVFWYAALIIGVLTFAALVLAPVFRAVPLTGADDSFGERLRSLLARAPRALSTGSSLLAGAIGTAAIIGASAALPSSPLQETGFVPPRVEEPAPPDDKKKDPPPPDDKQPPPTDPLTAIRNDITEIRNTINAHETSSTTHAHLIPTPTPPDDRAVTRIIELAEKVETTVSGLNDQISQRDAAITNQITNSRTAIEQKVAAVETRTQNVETQLSGAGTKIDARASALESTVILPHMLGERPSLLASTLGFDRYEVTSATTEFLKKVGAPPEVETAVANLGSTRYSNDELRLALRAQLCKPASHNCDVYLAWRNTVLRAARSN